MEGRDLDRRRARRRSRDGPRAYRRSRRGAPGAPVPPDAVPGHLGEWPASSTAPIDARAASHRVSSFGGPPSRLLIRGLGDSRIGGGLASEPGRITPLQIEPPCGRKTRGQQAGPSLWPGPRRTDGVGVDRRETYTGPLQGAARRPVYASRGSALRADDEAARPQAFAGNLATASDGVARSAPPQRSRLFDDESFPSASRRRCRPHPSPGRAQ